MKLTAALVASALVAGSAQAVTINVRDAVPNGDNGSGTRNLTTTLGSVSGTPDLPTMTYSVSNLDLTSVGGGASETIAFNITFTQTGGNFVEFNGFGNVAVNGGNNTQVDPGEALTATLSLNGGLTTFGGAITADITQITIGGRSNDEEFNVETESGTTNWPTGAIGNQVALPPTSFATLTSVVGLGNIQAYTVTIDAVPEPGSLALLGLGGLLVARRRR